MPSAAGPYDQVHFGPAAAWPPPPAVQNQVTVAWLLALFAILPSGVNSPPESWADAFRRDEEAGRDAAESAGTRR